MEPARRLRYVALGDSYTIGTSVAEADRWPNQLVARVPTLELVANLGVNGFTSRDLIEVELPQLDALRPEFITVLIGVNDVVQGVPPGDVSGKRRADPRRRSFGRSARTAPWWSRRRTTPSHRVAPTTATRTAVRGAPAVQRDHHRAASSRGIWSRTSTTCRSAPQPTDPSSRPTASTRAAPNTGFGFSGSHSRWRICSAVDPAAPNGQRIAVVRRAARPRWTRPASASPSRPARYH